MADKLTVAIIGCGGRGRAHANGFSQSNDATLAACADPVAEAAESFAERFEIPQHYTDHRQMLAEVKPDIVCVATWTALHLPLVRDAVDAGAKGVFVEKPMADNFKDSRELHRIADQAGVALAFCHQRRFLAQFVKARELVEAEAVGAVQRFEGSCPNMIDWGTHWFDMMNFLNNDEPAQSVIGQVHVEQQVKHIFGVPVDDQGVAVVQYGNGRVGLMVTGIGPLGFRILGEDGLIEARIGGGDMWRVRYLNGKSDGWQYPKIEQYEQSDYATDLACVDFVQCVKTGVESRLSSRRALQTTELVFAVYESARSRGRVDLPLQIDDNPLASMLEQGMIGPADYVRPTEEPRRVPKK